MRIGLDSMESNIQFRKPDLESVWNSSVNHPVNDLQIVESAKNKLKITEFVRLNPNAKNHAKFENKNRNCPSKQLEKMKIGSETQPLPEFSSERYYQTIKPFDIGKGGKFSLRNLFKKTQATLQEEEEEEDEEKMCSPKIFRMAQEVFIPEIVGMIKNQKYWKDVGMWHEPLFFLGGDVRFKESMDFVYRVTNDELYDRNTWPAQRDKLKEFYRNKMRRHCKWMAESSQLSQKKRPLEDVANELYYNFYSPQEEFERQKKKKPHRPFFK